MCSYSSFIRLLHYLVQQSICVALYAAYVLHDGIEGAELHGLVEILGEGEFVADDRLSEFRLCIVWLHFTLIESIYRFGTSKLRI